MNEVNELFEKKADEFMKYQKFILKDTYKTIRECFPPDIVNTLQYWRKLNGDFYTKSLHISTAKSTSENEVYVVIDNKYDISDAKYIQLNNLDNLYIYERYSKPKDIEMLKRTVRGFEKYKDFCATVKAELPRVTEYLCDWEKEYQKEHLDYLNSLDFSIPKDSVEEEEETQDMEM